ncbi:DUF5829 family protein [Glaciecola siphonariae]|uniref:DUF5829 family protein n=1 Tax=Glaciecola siphonariae TaxID=521012 RepID=A0ABV9LRX6_9ALTE
MKFFYLVSILSIAFLFACSDSEKSVNSNSQQISSPVAFNHMFHVLSPDDFAALKNSSFIQDTFAASEKRTTGADGQQWTGLYLYGEQSYVEFFEPVGLKAVMSNAEEGLSGIAFSVDFAGQLSTLSDKLEARYSVNAFTRNKTLENKETIPWFDYLFFSNDGLSDDFLLTHWVMEYKREYFDYMKWGSSEHDITRKSYLADKSAARKNKVLKDFTGLHLCLNASELRYYRKWFKALEYKEPEADMFIGPADGFTYRLSERKEQSASSLQSISFDNASEQQVRQITITENISIIINQTSGTIKFSDAC